MAPPPVTPSPHRFVIKKEAPVRKSTLSQQSQPQQTPRPSTQQFNTTPRFNFSSTPRPTATQSLPRTTPSASRYLTPASKKHDAIDESSDDILGDIHDSIETDNHRLNYVNEFSDDGEEYQLEERTPKRRRLSVSSIISQDEPPNSDPELEHQEQHREPSSSLPILSSPPIAATKRLSTTAPKFLPPTPLPPSTPLPSTGTTTFLKPPRFRPPDPSEQAHPHADPLPEHFSPHRKGQKYVHGGLAAEVQGWLFNLETAVPVKSLSRTEEKSEWLVKIVVDEVSGSSRNGFTMVRGRQIHGGDREMVDTVAEARVLLAGEGQAMGLQRGERVEAGKRVGIKGPVWEVVVEGVKWGVGVEWKVLD
ncbi:uncharacterized protein LY89DRAFT_707926 [Mollisia scopiformis]|uniref:Uncharacterized protein n=1 Tax=Mollisia scopiformis TaxID=149040 RepID=A0A194X6S1_MOLSC|nr:uncharacterized protein LY89DRAFT_707926 [Mollisia scopiformis]KUJ15779.1 hypothetical protein LY89DRAFT_707926 [Mollisia scopiformis]